ncbi:MAG: hypothetical protein JNG84_13210, partial [Archangium sp.]|nr:hypothetical protein [Archangium sp.]
FLELPLQSLPSNLAEVALFGSSSFAALRAVLEAEAASKEPIDPKVQAVPLPDPVQAMTQAREAVATQLAATTVQPLHALFAEGPTLGGHWYAVRTVLQACDVRRKVAAGAPTLDVPLSAEFGVVPWLSLVTKGNPGAPPPSMMWSSSRLFVGLGPLPVAVVQAFTGAALSSTKVWPLTTSQQTAVDGARAALRSVPELAKPETTFERILAALVVKA